MDKINELKRYLVNSGLVKESSAIEFLVKISELLDDPFYLEFIQNIISTEIQSAMISFREDLKAKQVADYQSGELRRQMGEDPAEAEEYVLTSPQAYASDISERVFGYFKEEIADNTPTLTLEDVNFSTEGIRTVVDKLSRLIFIFKNYYMGTHLGLGKPKQNNWNYEAPIEHESDQEKRFRHAVNLGVMTNLSNIMNELKEDLPVSEKEYDEEFPEYPEWMYEDDNFERFEEYLNEGSGEDTYHEPY